MPWTVFCCQLEAVVRHVKWTTKGQTVHLLAILQVQAANILYSVPAGLVYGDNVEVLKCCYRDHQLALAYHQDPARVCATIEQLAHKTFVGLFKYYIQRETPSALADGLRN
jgi:hypothetical protein